MRARFVRRRFAPVRRAKQNVQWSSISGAFTFAAISATTATVLISIENPVNLTGLTSDLPEDLTLLRIVGSFNLAIGNVGAATWTLALLVQSATWTPGATFPVDADKRVLWHETFSKEGAVTYNWLQSGTVGVGTGVVDGFAGRQSPVYIDIKPRVRIEPGEALYLVAYENLGGDTLTVGTTDMRVLYKRSGRR